MRRATRPDPWRLLDTLGGAALGALLLVGAQALAAPRASHASAPAPNPVATWQAGPYPGCTLTTLDNADVSDGANTVSHQVMATWNCPHALPPTLLTPTP